ncbi:interferon-induced very large GTPase 1-like, partial [Mercenaria mercenaria]|uniref:interferon-induced very large GTPase 1-like n=1 Tax=Mercenaria mercenaria TaxID=6596 RepID=UPI00234F6C37
MSDLSENTTEPSTRKATFDRLLKALGLEDKYPRKITMKDVTTIDLLEGQTEDPSEVNLCDIPQRFLKQLLTSNSEARDLLVPASKEEDTDFDTDDLELLGIDDTSDSNDISPLDILIVVFQCCDPMLQQMICQKMYLCKIAVPFSYVIWEGNNSRFEIPVWPLRSLTLGCSIYNADTPVSNNEFDILSLSTKVVAFSRFCRPNYSKSALLNKILSDQGHSTFFHKDCPSGATRRIVSNGYIEQFWLPTIDESKDKFKDALTFLNIRGAIEELDDSRLNFLSSFVDVMVMVVDQRSTVALKSEVENMLLKFPKVILIIASPLQKCDAKLLKEMQTRKKSKDKDSNLNVISTHKSGTERNSVDMALTISKAIRSENEHNISKPLEDRLIETQTHMCTIDENESTCQLGRKEAEIIINAMKEDGEARVWKRAVTPVQYTSVPKLGNLIKQHCRSQDLTETSKMESEIEQLRHAQTKMVSKSLRTFLNALTSKTKSKGEIAYFLGWLHYFIEREKRTVLPELMEKRKNAWEQLKYMEESGSSNKKSIEEQKELIKKIKTEVDEASFSIEHINREIGHIYNAAFKTNTDNRAIGLPPLPDVVEVYASLVANGQPLEVIDGDSSYMPYEWLKNILARVNQLLGKNTILALSVLGIQSSGKSTLLNTMFGSQFSTKTGRCTKGIHMQLVPVNTIPKQTYQNNFDYILVVDTEGLCSPELNSLDYEHDNELATVITGIGDMTLLNIMGENTSEIKDILEIVVHAFLRLKLSNKSIDLQKSCIFIHQNVTEPSASAHMSEGLNKLVSDLDKMTEISAHSEGIEGISKFNQVIAFDQKSQVWYLNNLWQGNPPMAKVNVGYSSRVVELRSEIIDHALQMKDKSFKSLIDILTNAYDLWKGVLNENFLFSFRNSIEVKASMDMEIEVQKNLWRFECEVLEEVSKVPWSRFASCSKNDRLADKVNAVITELHLFLDSKMSKIENNVTKFFDENEYKQIIKQWKQGQLNKIDVKYTALDKTITDEVHKAKERRELELFAESRIEKHEEVLRKESMNSVNKYRGKDLSDTEINMLFEDVWKPFEDEVKKSSKPSGEVNCIRDILIESLCSIFKRERAILDQTLHARNDLKCQNAQPISLKGSFKETGIDETDFSYSLVKKVKEFIKSQNAMPNIITRIDQVFEEIERKMAYPTDVELTKIHVNAILHHLGQKLKEIERDTDEISFKSTFSVKLYVHVSCYVHYEFVKHNQNHSLKYGIDAKLRKFKEQQIISFGLHIKNRKKEDRVAELFCNVLKDFIHNITLEILPIKATKELIRILPVSKKRLIICICTDLIDDDNFDNFIDYINSPDMYANKWLLQKSKEYLFGSSEMLFELAKEIADSHFKDLNRCFQESVRNNQNASITKLLDEFLLQLQNKKLSIPSDDLKDVRINAAKIAESSFQDVVKLIESKKDEVITKLKIKLRSDCVENIQWRGSNPYSKVENELWGCTEKCAFCGEPCEGTKDHSGKHRTIQHRPPCCKGVREGDTGLARLASCNVNVKSEDRAHGCGVFAYRCNP